MSPQARRPSRNASSEANVLVVESFWDSLGRRDFVGVGALMSEGGHYVDVPVLGIDEGAFGPAETEARVRLGLEPLHAYELTAGTITATGDLVITEHAETWTWEPGVSVRLPFVSVQEVRAGKVDRWWDYFDLQTLMNAAPAWWVDHIASGYK